jgi:hypothetical protein
MEPQLPPCRYPPGSGTDAVRCVAARAGAAARHPFALTIIEFHLNCVPRSDPCQRMPVRGLLQVLSTCVDFQKCNIQRKSMDMQVGIMEVRCCLIRQKETR